MFLRLHRRPLYIYFIDDDDDANNDDETNQGKQ